MRVGCSFPVRVLRHVVAAQIFVTEIRRGGESGGEGGGWARRTRIIRTEKPKIGPKAREIKPPLKVA